MTMTETVSSALNRAGGAIDRGTNFLLSQIGEDGSPGAAHCHYYRVPWALAITGNRPAASAVLTWVEKVALDEAGDLKPAARSGFESKWASYPLANLATGAWHLERYDTASLLLERLADFQHPETGGAFAAHPEHRSNERQDLFPTAQMGMTGLTTGNTNLADGAYNWMSLLWEAQQDLPERLFTATEGEALVTEFNGDPDLEWQMVTDFGKPRQAFYNPGIAAAFLGRYYMATGKRDALDLAKAYLDLTIGGSEIQFDFGDSVQVCKFGWGASVLLEATGDHEYLRHALRMVSLFCDSQNDDGSWDNSPFLMERADDRRSVQIEITAEFVQHLTTIVTAIAGSSPA